MSGFTKLFSCITTSSIWNEDDKVRLVWVTMLALAGPDGVVRASVGGLAHTARVAREDCERAIQTLQAPDADSRSPEFEGRRIERVDGGFLLLNFGKYREARSEAERTEYMRRYMQEYRKRDVNNRKQNVNAVKRSKPQLAKAEADIPAKPGSEALGEVSPKPPPRMRARGGSEPFQAPTEGAWVDYGRSLDPPFPRDDAKGAYAHYDANGWRTNQGPAKDWKGLLRTCYYRWKKLNPQTVETVGFIPTPADPNIADLAHAKVLAGWCVDHPNGWRGSEAAKRLLQAKPLFIELLTEADFPIPDLTPLPNPYSEDQHHELSA